MWTRPQPPRPRSLVELSKNLREVLECQVQGLLLPQLKIYAELAFKLGKKT